MLIHVSRCPSLSLSALLHTLSLFLTGALSLSQSDNSCMLKLSSSYRQKLTRMQSTW